MKILAVNGSPRKKSGQTDRVLQPFLEGAREAGAEAEIIYLQGKKIKPCLGCYNCWLKTPGVCAQKDEMAELLPMLREAEVAVYATPLYVCGMSAQMKTFLDRIIPNYEPWIELRNGHCRHPKREGNRMRGMVLVSVCGFHELDNFQALLAHMKLIADIGQIQFLGALLRPHAESLPFLEQFKPDKVKPVYEAAREAGRRVAEGGRIPEELEKQVAAELIPLEAFLKTANAYFKSRREQNGVPAG